ncbi:MAG TPA: hypothetical protein VFK20_00080 [Vicinamibacterales bacterium]|nr:hypothetical protein [Vicinamibacterales bacterium]
MIRFIAAGMLIVGASAMSACASAQAKTAADRPSLSVPPPPPRIFGPIESTPAAPEPVPDLPPAPAPNRPPRTTPSREPAAKEPVKPETRPETVPEQPAPTPPATATVPQLSTPQTVDSTEASKTVRVTLDRANGMLSGVDYQRLSAERRTQYDTAKRFIQQAQDAIAGGNLVYAQSLAEKADTIAKELAGK